MIPTTFGIVTRDEKVFNLNIDLFKYSPTLANLKKKKTNVNAAQPENIQLDNRVPSDLFQYIIDYLIAFDKLNHIEYDAFVNIFIKPPFDINSNKLLLNDYSADMKKWYETILKLRQNKRTQLLGIAQFLEIESLVHVMATIHAKNII